MYVIDSIGYTQYRTLDACQYCSDCECISLMFSSAVALVQVVPGTVHNCYLVTAFMYCVNHELERFRQIFWLAV